MMIFVPDLKAYLVTFLRKIFNRESRHHMASGILTGEDIWEEIENGRLIKYAIREGVQACSYDLRIGTIFSESKILRKSSPEQDPDPVILGPGGIISLFTWEELELPDDISATAFAMNVMSSQGVLVLNPGHVDPGFRGALTVRIINVRATSKALLFGTPIFTVIFQRLPKATNRPYNSNKPRAEREIAFKAIDVEQNPKTLLRLLKAGDEKPLMTPEEIDRRITKHWATLVTLVLAVLTTVLAFAATIFAAMALFPKPEPAPIRATSATELNAKPTLSPSVTPAAPPTAPPKP
jgi:deoxycytidine triphosphate deaminase